MNRWLNILLISVFMILSCSKDSGVSDSSINNNFKGDWTEYRGNNFNSGFSQSSAPSVSPINLFNEGLFFDISINEYFSNSPIVVNNILFAATFVPWIGPDNYYFKAFNIITGEEKWSFKTDQIEEYFSNPAIYNEIIYIGGSNGLYALDIITGKELWGYSTGPANGNPSVNSPTVSNDIVYFEANDNVYALDRISGQKIWQLNINSLSGEEMNYVSSFSEKLTVSNNLVFISISGVSKSYNYINSLYALNSNNGEVIWKYSLNTDIFLLTAVSNDNIFFVSSGLSNNKSYCYALNVNNGIEKWKTELEGYSAPESGPALGYGMVFIPTYDGSLYGLDINSGQIKWKSNTGSGGVQSNSPSVANNMVFIGGIDGFLYAFDVYSGVEKWKYGSGYGSYNFSGPIVANGLVIYEQHGYLTALK